MKTKNKKEDSQLSSICLACLECCKYISFEMPLSGSRKIYEEFCRVRDLELVDVTNGVVYVRMKKTCWYLTPAGCSIYEQRPVACRMYDGTKDGAMADKCKWKNLNEDK